MATVTYLGPPVPGWADPQHAHPDDPDAEWVDDRGTYVLLPDGRRIIHSGEALDVPDAWVDPDDPAGREWPDALWRVDGGPEDRRRVGELRSALAARGLSIAGRKPELLARLQEAERADPDGAQIRSARTLDLGSPDNPGDFPDAPAADTAVEQAQARADQQQADAPSGEGE